MLDKNDPRLTAFVLRELPAEELAKIRKEVDASPELQTAVAEIESMTSDLRNAFSDEPIAGLTNGQKNTISKKVAAVATIDSGVVHIHSNEKLLWPNRILAALAATLILVLGTVIVSLLYVDNLNVQSVARLSNDLEIDPFNDQTFTSEELEKLGRFEIPAEISKGEGLQAFSPSLSLIVSGDPDKDETSSGDLELGFQDFSDDEQPFYGGLVDTDSRPAFFPDTAEWESKKNRRSKFQDVGLPRVFGLLPTESEPIESNNELITETLSVSDGRTEDRSGESELEGFLAPPAENVTDLPTRRNLNSSGPRSNTTGTSRSQFQASFQVDKHLAQAEIQLQVALQRFGPTHPSVKELRKSIQMWRRFQDSSLERTEQLDPARFAKSFAETLVRLRSFDFAESEIKSDAIEFSSDSTYQNLEDHVWNLSQESRMFSSRLQLNDLTASRSYLESVDLSSLYKQDETKKVDSELLNQINKRIREQVAEHNQRIRQKPKSWKRVKATGNTSRLIVGDKDELDLAGMQVHVQVDAFRARVLVDYFYYNDRDQQLEGNFKLRLPDDASLYYFAFGQSAYDFSPENGLAADEFASASYVSLQPAEIGLARQDAWKDVKEARMVPREKAAFAYSQTVRRRVDPALVEWSGAGVFNARVFPLVPHKLHRVVIGYDVNLTATDDGFVYKLDLPEQKGQCRVDLSVSDIENGKWDLTLEGEERSSTNSEWESKKPVANSRSLKRMQFDDPKWNSLVLTGSTTNPVVLKSGENEQGAFFATRMRAELPKTASQSNDKAVFLLDTSLSSRPEKFNVWLKLMNATLENNRGSLKGFAILFFDVENRFWRTSYTENTRENVQALIKDCYQLGLEGATDLYGAMKLLSESQWITADGSQPDLFLLSDGAANWGETNLHLIQDEFEQANLSSLFAYQTGLSGTAISNLRFLAGKSGGAVFSVASEDEVARASTAHRSRPWRLDSIQAKGTLDLMTAGRTEWVYPGQWLTVVGRGVPEGKLVLNLSQGDAKKSLVFDGSTVLESEMASRLFGHVAVGQLETLGHAVFDIAAAYSRHFRITGRTCSLLMLETEADYQRFNIKPEEDWFVVQSKPAAEIVDQELDKNKTLLADPKAQLVSWIARLESMPELKFRMPTALKVVMDDIKVEAIDGRLECKKHGTDDWLKKYVDALNTGRTDSGVLSEEALRRKAISADDALKVYSNLIEQNPGDWVVARDVAFTAMELDRPAAAYHLLRNLIDSRPYEGSTYAAIGHCLGALGKADMAIVFYELALGSSFPNQGRNFRQIVATEYASLLNRIKRDELETSVGEFAAARAESIRKITKLEKCDVIVSMMWNTDQTDVDLHVIEPSGEECSYQNKETNAGGRITEDIQNGFGPEMYTIESAPDGEFQVQVHFFGSNQSRTQVANKVYLNIFRNFGTPDETVTSETVELKQVGQKELVHKIGALKK